MITIRSKTIGKINQATKEGRSTMNRVLGKDTRIKPDTKEENRYSCKVCNEKTHSILLGCPEFQRFIPGQPGGSDSPPKEVCLMCLGTVYSNCLHKSLADYKKYFCKIGKRHFIICRCLKHENAQDWMRVNYDPKKGRHNMDDL